MLNVYSLECYAIGHCRGIDEVAIIITVMVFDQAFGFPTKSQHSLKERISIVQTGCFPLRSRS
jgi:hypothetical protein